MRINRRVMVSGLLAGLTGLPSARAQQTKAEVGLSMPTLALQRWVVDGLALVRSLDKLGYSSDLQFANNEVPTQIAQIDAMLQKEPAEGEQQTDIIMLTHQTQERNIEAAIAKIEALTTVMGSVMKIRLEELN